MHSPHATRRPAAFTVVELLVVLAIVGVLAAILLPALQSARESARRTACQNHLRQLGLALLNHHDARQAFPPGWQGYESTRHEVSVGPGWSWVAHSLPYLEQRSLADQLDLSRSILDPRNDLARQTSLAGLRCPSAAGPAFFELKPAGSGSLGQFPTANYVANFGATRPQHCEALAGLGRQCTGEPYGGVFFHNSRVRLAEITDGTSVTILAGERKSDTEAEQSPVATWVGATWEAEGSFARVLGSAFHTWVSQRRSGTRVLQFTDYSSEHPGGTYFVYADGHVALVSRQIDHLAFVDLATREETYANLNGASDPPTPSGAIADASPPTSDPPSTAPTANPPAPTSLTPATGGTTMVYVGSGGCPCCRQIDYTRPVYLSP
ncbi:MAG: DUF1559 domain-containing protein [Pirellulaceae bacterium]|nr:DUF1559 domain-containing protein [Pirellulaceae bacterium]